MKFTSGLPRAATFTAKRKDPLQDMHLDHASMVTLKAETINGLIFF